MEHFNRITDDELFGTIAVAFNDFELINPKHQHSGFEEKQLNHLFRLIAGVIRKHRTGRLLSKQALANFFEEFITGKLTKTFNRFGADLINDALNEYQNRMRNENFESSRSQRLDPESMYQPTDWDRTTGSMAIWMIQKSLNRSTEIKQSDRDFLQSLDQRSMDWLMQQFHLVLKDPESHRFHPSLLEYLGLKDEREWKPSILDHNG